MSTQPGGATKLASVGLDPTLIGNLTLVTALAGDLLWIVDATDGLSKKVDAADFLGGGGGQTPIIQDVDYDGFDIKDLSNLEFRITTLAPAITVQSIWADAGGINFNVPNNSFDFEFKIGGTPMLTLGNTILDVHGHEIRDMVLLSESGVTDFASVINLVNSSYIAWQNVADTDFTNGIRVDADIFEIFISDADGLDGWNYLTVSRTSTEFLIGGILEYSFTATAFTLSDANNIVVGTTTGSKIGTSTTQKIGFWNVTPIVQPTHIADATDAATVITQLNALLAQMAALGLQAAA